METALGQVRSRLFSRPHPPAAYVPISKLRNVTCAKRANIIHIRMATEAEITPNQIIPRLRLAFVSMNVWTSDASSTL